jgi:hypothetical protein
VVHALISVAATRKNSCQQTWMFSGMTLVVGGLANSQAAKRLGISTLQEAACDEFQEGFPDTAGESAGAARG